MRVIKSGGALCPECGERRVLWEVVIDDGGQPYYSNEILVGCPRGHDIGFAVDVERRVVTVPKLDLLFFETFKGC